MLEAYSSVDKDLAELNGDVAGTRFTEATAFIESMHQEAAQTLFYGNSAINKQEFNGLAVRYSSTVAGNGVNIIKGGSADTDNTSIYLVGWGQNTIHGIFPKGSKAGLTHEDLGLETVQLTVSGETQLMRAYRDHWQWKLGIALKDWRYVARICNIEVSALAGMTPADLTNLMIQAMHRIPNLSACKPVFYMNRTVFQYLDIQRRDAVKDGGQLSYEVVDGKRIPMFRGIPIKVCDAILNSESLVS